MNIVKLGGSLVNPDGKYDQKAIQKFIDLVKDSQEKFIFVVGGGRLCRQVQEASKEFLKTTLGQDTNYASDWLGIAVTSINADYVRQKFSEQLKEKVYPEILVDPTKKVDAKYQVYLTGGWKPGCSTDTDMMLLAKNFQAKKVFKISDFKRVKNIKPIELLGKTKKERDLLIQDREDLSEMTWLELKELIGTEWVAGLNTPFDPKAVSLGYQLKDTLTLYIGRKEEFSKMLAGEKFIGTTVKD